MMKKILLVLLTSFIGQVINAQIVKTNIVEHFTNSNCSICANQNPGIYTTLGNNPNVLHITFHPSAPYAACVFSMANPIENDARTNFYNIYGGTPRLIVNGVLTTTANLSSTLSSLSTSMTNFHVKTTQQFITPDSILVNVIVKKIAADTMTQALLFAGAKQDTINQTTGNGESIHQDVFRKGLTSMTGNSITLPTNINDSTVYIFNYKVAPTWIASRMQTIAILQNPMTKSVINASESSNIISTPTGITSMQTKRINVYPNPATSVLYVENISNYTAYEIINYTGSLVEKATIERSSIPIAHLSNGLYILKLLGTEKETYSQFNVQH